jgi:hypothetical protein
VLARAIWAAVNSVVVLWFAVVVGLAVVVLQPTSSLGGAIAAVWMESALRVSQYFRRRFRADTLLPYGLAFLVGLRGAAGSVIVAK